MIYVLAELDPDTGEQSRFVKIGYAGRDDQDFLTDARRRANELQTGNPRRLVVIGAMEGEVKDEKSMHDTFRRWRVVHAELPGEARSRSVEWFRVLPGSDLAAWVESVRVSTTDDWSALIAGVHLGRAKSAQQPQLTSVPAGRRQPRPARSLWPVDMVEAKTDEACAWCGEMGHVAGYCENVKSPSPYGDGDAPAVVAACRWCGRTHADRDCARFQPATRREARRWSALARRQG